MPKRGEQGVTKSNEIVTAEVNFKQVQGEQAENSRHSNMALSPQEKQDLQNKINNEVDSGMQVPPDQP